VWLEEHNIPFEERNIMKSPMSREEIKHILSLTEGGTEEIISVRSKLFSDMKTAVDDLTLNEMINLIQQYPALIKRPLLVDEKCLQVGYNEDEIRCFLPRRVRRAELARLTLLA
jgi:regulatory protein spx